MNPNDSHEDEFIHTMLGALGRYHSRVINIEIGKGLMEGKEFRVPKDKVLDVRSVTPLAVELKDKAANRCELCKYLGRPHCRDSSIFYCIFRQVYVSSSQGCNQFKASADVSPPEVEV